MYFKKVLIFIQLFLINYINCEILIETKICGIDRIDAITNLSNQTLWTFKGNRVWISKNGRIQTTKLISDHWIGSNQYFDENLNDLIFDEKEGVSLLFKNNYFWISMTSRLDLRNTSKEIINYFPEVTKIDASLLLVDERKWCWQHSRCQTLYLFEGHFLWSYNWYHFWHIENRDTHPIDMKSININFPDHLDAAFAQNNHILLVRDNFYFRVPIDRFPLKVLNEDLRPLSLFDDIIRCHYYSEELIGISSVLHPIFVNKSISGQHLNSTFSYENDVKVKNENLAENESTVEMESHSLVSNIVSSHSISTKTTMSEDLSSFENEVKNKTEILSSVETKAVKQTFSSNSVSTQTTFAFNKNVNLSSSESDISLDEKNLEEKDSTEEIARRDQLTEDNLFIRLNDSEIIQNHTINDNNDSNKSISSESSISTQTTFAFVMNEEFSSFESDINSAEKELTEENLLIRFNDSEIIQNHSPIDSKNVSSIESEIRSSNFKNELKIEVKNEKTSENESKIEIKNFKNDSNDHRLMSITTVWIIAFILIFAVIIGAVIWKNTRNTGYYNLDNQNE